MVFPCLSIKQIWFSFLDPPLPPTTNPIDLFGYNVGQPGIIKVDIQANPKPQIEWTVRDQHIKEGTTDSSGRIAAEIVKDLVRKKQPQVFYMFKYTT